jgi:hypothetical protein
MKKVERWKTEMPTEEEMLPKDKYTVFDRKVKRYRKGIHSKWHMLWNYPADALGDPNQGPARLAKYVLTIYRGAEVDKSQSTTQSSRFLDGHHGKGWGTNVYFTVTIRIASMALWKGCMAIHLILPPQKCMVLVFRELTLIDRSWLVKYPQHIECCRLCLQSTACSCSTHTNHYPTLRCVCENSKQTDRQVQELQSTTHPPVIRVL